MQLEWTFLKMSHSDPLIKAFKGGTMTRASPSVALSNALDRRSRFSMVSLISYVRHSDELELLRNPVIAFAGQTLSTLLVSNGKDMQKHMNIAVSADTETTKWYMSNVLRYLGLDIRLRSSEYIEASDLLSEADYALVIGDEALKVFSSNLKILLDIGSEFLNAFQMLPLYAVSVSGARENENDDTWIMDAEQYKSECAENLADRLGISPILTGKYYANVRFQQEKSISNTLSFVMNSFRK